MAQTVRDFLQAQALGKLAEIEKMAKAAEDEGRGLTDEENAKAESGMAEYARMMKDVDDIDKAASLQKSIDDARGTVTTPVEETPEGAATIGEAFVKSAGYKTLKAAGLQGTWTTGAVEIGGAKATVTETASPVIVTDVKPGIIPLPTWPTRVADLFAQGTTTSTTVRLITETSETNAAAGVAELGAKPESTIVFVNADFTVGKIATSLPVSDEMLEDVDQMQSFLDNRLALFIRRVEDSDLLNGAGTPTVKGILQFSGIQSGSALSLDVDSSIDAIFRAMTLVRVTGLYEPDGIVMHPTDWAGVRLMKDQNEQYYGGGPFTGAYGGSGGIAGDSLWGLPVVTTTSIAQGTALIGAFKTAAQIYRRRGLTVEASNSHDTNFTHNITTIRAEERLALAVWRELAFYKLTGVDQLLGS